MTGAQSCGLYVQPFDEFIGKHRSTDALQQT